MSESFETFYNQTKAQYTPNLMEYTPEDLESLRNRIAAYLRPSYEQALKKQEKQAAAYNGKLDADAWSRGMGSSTYVSDLKYRRQNELLENRTNLEASYGAALAEQLYKAWEKQLGYRMEVEQFNAQAKNDANQKALAAAGNLYQSYLSSLNKSSGGSSVKKKEEEPEKEADEVLLDTSADEEKEKYRQSIIATTRLRLRNQVTPGGGNRQVTQTYLGQN